MAALTIVLAGRAAPAQAEVFGEVIRPSHSGLCLAVEGGSTTPGADVVQETCSGSNAQIWTATALGDGGWQIRVAHSDQCLDVEGGVLEPGAQLIQWPCGPGANQQFDIATAGGLSTIVARHSGLCLDIFGGSVDTGADLIQWTCTSGANQRFNLGGGDVGGGRWTPRIDLPLVPVAASALANGNILMWSAYDRFTFGGDRGLTQTLTFDPSSYGYSERQVANTGHDMFCPGIANLADGRILVNGGSSSAETSVYNPSTDRWEDAADMNIPRGYQGTTLLSDGSAFTLGGSWSGGQGNKHAEIWTDDAGWRRLSGVRAEPFTGDDPQGVYRGDNHLWLFAWTGNRVFHAGPTRQMHWVTTSGEGAVTNAGNRGSDAYAINGNAVMFAPGRILTTGGAPAYQNADATTNATVIDLNGGAVSSRSVSPMANRRAFHNSVVLPNGEVVVVGGQTVPVPFSDAGAILTTEIWNPTTETFRPAAPMATPRTYHSFALLQPDGRVLVGGGGLCGGCATNHPDVEIFTPPYLLDAEGGDAVRPRIISAPDSLDLSQQFTVTTNRPITELALVRMASATHSVNLDQRRIPLPFSQDGNLSYRVTAPADPGVAIPGAYMLFALDGDGVPSEAAILIVSNRQDPGGNQASVSGTVADEAGQPVGNVTVDLFRANPDGSRQAWLTSSDTSDAGNFGFTLDPGAYVLTFIAPPGQTFTNGSPWYQTGFSVGAGEAATGLDATLSGGGDGGGGAASISGRVTDGAGAPVAGVAVDLFEANGDGSRGAWLGQVSTGPDGAYSHQAEAGCYVLTFIAPDGRTFSNGSRWYQPSRCLQPAEQATGVDAVLN